MRGDERMSRVLCIIRNFGLVFVAYRYWIGVHDEFYVYEQMCCLHI